MPAASAMDRRRPSTARPRMKYGVFFMSNKPHPRMITSYWSKKEAENHVAETRLHGNHAWIERVPADNPIGGLGVALIGAAVLAAGITIAVVATAKPAAAAANPGGGGGMTPPTVPPGATFLTPITDAPTVTQYQTILANAVADPSWTGPTLVYPITAVNGNPADPTWMRELAAVQQYINSQGWDPTKVPAGFPAQLRTDGVLDYATALVFVNS